MSKLRRVVHKWLNKIEEQWLRDGEREFLRRAEEPRPDIVIMRSAIEHLTLELIEARRALMHHEFGGAGQWSNGACRMPNCDADHPRMGHGKDCIFHDMPRPPVKL